MSGALEALSGGERALLRPAAAPRRVTPMKAVLTDARFSDPGWIFERKLDGIRCGEVVAFDGPRTSFARLARRGRGRVAVFLYAFDVLHLDGHDVRALPLRARKRLLRRALSFEGPVRLTPYRNEAGEELYAEACRKGWEGLAKRADSPYASTRSKDWLKLKCSAEQELVIGGYTAPQGSRRHLGALLVGHFDGDELVYAGLVAQVGFSEWTRDGRLRHPRFLGLREDKRAREVVRERAAAS